MADSYDINKDRYIVPPVGSPSHPGRRGIPVTPSDTLDVTNASGDNAPFDLMEGRRSPHRAILEAALAAAIADAERPSEPRSREGLPAQYRAALDLWEGRPSPHRAILEAALTPMPDDIANSRGH
jgi:hypothetical protein